MGCVPLSKSLTFGSYEILKQVKIAEGGYGEIWKCKAVSSDKIYALKEIRLQTSQLETMFNKEVRLLKKLSESKVKGSIILKQSNVLLEGKDKKGCLLFQFGTITLLDELGSKHLSQQQILNILKDICESLEQIHSLGIYHLDLKPQNLILVENRYKICDFGSAIDTAIHFDQLDKKKADTFMEYIDANSTLHYRSPEMIDPAGKIIGAPSDIWMLGCICYLMIFRKHPFQGEGKLAIITGNTKYPKEGFITQLIKEMLVLQYSKRPSPGQLKSRIESELKIRKEKKS